MSSSDLRLLSPAIEVIGHDYATSVSVLCRRQRQSPSFQSLNPPLKQSASLAFTPARPLPAWQLTKRALVGGDAEKVALEWANEQVWAGCTGQIAGQERSRFRS